MHTPSFLVGLATCVMFGPAAAVELDQLDIDIGKGSYEVAMSFSVAAAPASVIAALTDYGNPESLNPDVTHRQVLGEKDGLTRVRTEFRGCAIFFCREVAMVQDVSVEGGRVTADIVPGHGDFSAGRLEWLVVANGEGGSNIEFSATMTYEFFVMPVFGRMLMRKRLRHQLLETAANLEREAAR